MKETRSAGGIVLNPKGEVIIVSNKPQNVMTFPKGHVNEGESDFDAAKREIKEETGVSDLKFIKKLGEYRRPSWHKTEMKTIVMFLFKAADQELKPHDAENPEVEWVSKEEAPKRLAHPADREFFSRVLNQLK